MIHVYSSDLPVDTSDGGVLAEGRGVLLAVLPDLLALLHVIGGVERVVDADDHD